MKKVTTKQAVIIVCILFLISMLGSYMVQTSFFTVKQKAIICNMNELTQTIAENEEKYGKDLGPTLSKAGLSQISLTVYIPKNATPENPAPAIICAHGWNNSKEQQILNFVELSRRGFVVVTVDLAGHGQSDVTLQDESGWGQGNSECALAAVEYAMSLGCVDETRVGVIGHSAGDLAVQYAIMQLNVEGSKKHISSYCDSAGAISALIMGFNPAIHQGIVLDVIMGKYEEMSDAGFDLPHSGWGTMIFNGWVGADKLNADGTIPINVYYDVWENKGAVIEDPADPRDGYTLLGKSAIKIEGADVTHPGAVFSTETAAQAIDFFYDVYGIPSGAKYIAPNKQIWVLGTVFQVLGMLTFFASAFVFGAALLERKRFSGLIRPVPMGDQLASIKSWKEIVPILVTFIPLVIFAYKMYFPLYDARNLIMKETTITDCVSGIAVYTAVSGVFAFFMIGVNFFVSKLCHIKDGTEVKTLFNTARVDSFSQFGNAILLAMEVIALMYIPQIIAYYLFDVNFGISVFVVGVPRLVWLPTVIKNYWPMWFIWVLPNALLNVRARWKDTPEWATTLFIVLASALPIMILTFVNYAHLHATGVTLFTAGDPSIFAWNLFAPTIFGALVCRYYYKKTGSIWTGVFIATTVMVLMATTITRHLSDVAFFC